ncbi:MAG TPA: ribosomal protein L7/L12 [Dermatophilaceae bacterium]|jgi:ribosomal protein L7/L12
MTDPTSLDPMPIEPASAKGWRGLLQRRAEAMLLKPRRASAALTEPGERHVVLQLIGPSPVQVIAIISQATGLDLVSANNLARDAPVVVVSGISEASADRVVERLQKAGARAVAGESYRPE